MICWLTEDALVQFLTGVFVTVAFLVMAWLSQEKKMSVAAICIAAINSAVVTTERLIVTDREFVTELVYKLA